MTLFDYRTDFFLNGGDEDDDSNDDDDDRRRAVAEPPTFMYAMPLGEVEGGGQRVFFEETSLVARPGAISIDECKARCMARLEHLGVKIKPGSIHDEERCCIPMGGPLPDPNQRTVAFGGAAAMVHPSTGYHLCRMMAGAASLARSLDTSLLNGLDPGQTAAAAYDAVWSSETQAQRDFAVFGGEFLMSLDIEGLRSFFKSFFALPEPLWAGFLAGWPSLPHHERHSSWSARATFGLSMLAALPLSLSAQLLTGALRHSVSYGVPLVRSLTPFFGLPSSYAT
mmetsp:Transcript_31957/g.68042  ORF Transcript_31957/g.68042 Transcript_31957/m.68042 type:complete len:282 (-) Transcript_31957:65-910(-)